MAYDDVHTMIRLAHEGDEADQWHVKAEASSRLFSGSRRTTQLRIARSLLRTTDGYIADGTFLSEVARADASTARDLIYGRYLAGVPIAVAVARLIFHSLAREGRRFIERSAIESFLNDQIGTVSVSTRARTFSSILTEFSRAGVLVRPGPRQATLQLTGRVPAAAALADLIDTELLQRREAPDRWLSSESLAAAIFAIPAEPMQTVIEALVNEGRLRRSYYSGEPRIIAA
jgi:hypothetical protein